MPAVYDDQQQKPEIDPGGEAFDDIVGRNFSGDEVAGMERRATEGAEEDRAESGQQEKGAADKGDKGGAADDGKKSTAGGLGDGASSAAGAASKVAGAAGGPAGALMSVLNSKKKKGGAAGGLIALVMILVGFFMGSGWLGPMELVHFAQNMQKIHMSDQEEMSKSRTARLLMFHKYNDVSKSRLGYIANKFDDKITASMKENGFKLNVDSVTGNFKGFEFDPKGSKEGPLHGLRGRPDDEIKGRLAEALGVDKEKITVKDGKFTIPNDGFKRISNGRLIGRVYGVSTDKGKAWSAYQKRILIKKVGLSFDPTTKLKQKTSQTVVDKVREIKEERSRRLTGQATDVNVRNAAETDEDGRTTPEAEEDARGANDLQNDAKSGKLKSTSIKGAIGIGFLCAVKSIADGASAQNKANSYMVSMHAANEVLSVATKGQEGKDIDARVINDVYAKSLYSKKNGSWSDSNTFKAEFGKGPGVKLPDELDPNQSSNVTSQLLAELPGLTGACNFLNNGFVSLITAAMDGPVGLALEGALRAGLADGLIAKIVGLFSDDVPDLSSAKYAGGIYGESVGVGNRLIANETSLSMAGAVLDDKQESQLAMYVDNELQAQYAQSSTYDKLFNTKLATSAVSRFIDQINPSTPQTMVASTFGAAMSMPTSMISTIIPKAAAADNPIKYVNKRELYYNIPKVGFTVESTDKIDNPIKNANEAADMVAEYSERLIKCNNIQAVLGPHGLDFIVGSGITDDYENLALGDCKADADENFVKFRMAAYDTINAKSVACIEWDDVESCNDIAPPISEGLESGDAGTAFRIATFNVLGASHTESGKKADEYASAEDRMVRAVQIMNSAVYDIIGLQEFQAVQRDKFIELAGSKYAIYPSKPEYSGNSPSYNSIIWDKAKFTKIDGPEGSGTNPFYYFDGDKEAYPWVRLRDNTTKQEFVVMNTHDPVTNDANGHNDKWRYEDAKIHLKDMQKAMEDGTPVLMTGDFNSAFVLRDRDSRLGGDRDKLTYCVMTKTDEVFNAFDVWKGRNGHCPTDNSNDDGFKGTIDHVYMSGGIQVTDWQKIENADTKYTTDHPLVVADVLIPAGGGAGWQWPVHKEDVSPGNAGLAQCWLSYYDNKKGYHAAIDIRVRYKPVYAVHDGTVVAKHRDGYNSLIIDTGKDPRTGKTLYAVYLHMQSFKGNIAVGSRVVAGQEIGTSGEVGSEGFPHLHFGISDSKEEFGFYSNPWHTANPLDFLPNAYDPKLLRDDNSGSCLTKDIINKANYGFVPYARNGTFDEYK